MNNVGGQRLISSIARSGPARVLFKLILIALCAFCLQSLCGCTTSKSGDEAATNQAIKYATSRTLLDLTPACVVREVPDAKIEIALLGFETKPDGEKEIKLEAVIVSDTMASWTADDWANNRVDLFFNFAAHFSVICKQAHEFGSIPENYAVTCPDYMVVYDSKKSAGFIVSSSGVYKKGADLEKPIGEPVVLATQN